MFINLKQHLKPIWINLLIFIGYGFFSSLTLFNKSGGADIFFVFLISLFLIIHLISSIVIDIKTKKFSNTIITFILIIFSFVNVEYYLKFALTYQDIQRANAGMAERFNQMIEQGLVAEVEHLKTAYPELNGDYPSQRAVGYRQIWDYLDGLMTKEEAIERAIIATRQYAKRQRTWLRSETNLITMSVENPEFRSQIRQRIEEESC